MRCRRARDGRPASARLGAAPVIGRREQLDEAGLRRLERLLACGLARDLQEAREIRERRRAAAALDRAKQPPARRRNAAPARRRTPAPRGGSRPLTTISCKECRRLDVKVAKQRPTTRAHRESMRSDQVSSTRESTEALVKTRARLTSNSSQSARRARSMPRRSRGSATLGWRARGRCVQVASR